MANKQLYQLTETFTTEDNDIYHLQNVAGFDRHITKANLLATTQSQIDAGKVINLRASGYTAVAGERVLANNTSSVPTINLPATPTDGQWVEIGGATLYSINEVIVEGGTNDIMVTSDTTCTLDGDMDKSVFKFIWNSSDDVWKIRLSDVEGEIM